jgi:DNA polymerase III sliding clamp (beta) subunit (PCNA family)
MNTKIKPNELAAVLLASHKDKTEITLASRLKGVQVELHVGTVSLIATDGNRLHAINLNSSKEVQPLHAFTLSNEAIDKVLSLSKLFKKELGKHAVETVTIGFEYVSETEVHVSIYGGDNPTPAHTVIAKPLDSTFPDYKRVIPDDSQFAPCDILGLNAPYLADIAKAASLLTDGFPHIAIRMTGNYAGVGSVANALVITIKNVETFTALVMPCEI